MDSIYKFSAYFAYKFCNLIFVGILNLLRIPQRANIAGCPDSANVSEFRKFIRIPLTICGFRKQYAESAYNLRIPLTICGFHRQLRVQTQLQPTERIYCYCSDFRYESNGIFVLGVGFFSSDKFRLFN